LLAGVLAALEDAVTALREQLTQANRRAESERQRVDEALTRADALRDRLDAAQAQLAAAEDTARSACADARVVQDWATAVERANAARRSAGVLARLRAAWRGE
jgi:predicted  nucleic acid-binding Zn-ribbon protein